MLLLLLRFSKLPRLVRRPQAESLVSPSLLRMDDRPTSDPLTLAEQVELLLEQPRWLAFHTARLEHVLEAQQGDIQRLQAHLLDLSASFVRQLQDQQRALDRLAREVQRLTVFETRVADRTGRLEEVERVAEAQARDCRADLDRVSRVQGLWIEEVRSLQASVAALHQLD